MAWIWILASFLSLSSDAVECRFNRLLNQPIVRRSLEIQFQDAENARQTIDKLVSELEGVARTEKSEAVAGGKRDQKLRHVLSSDSLLRATVEHYLGDDIPLARLRHKQILTLQKALTNEAELTRLMGLQSELVALSLGEKE